MISCWLSIGVKPPESITMGIMTISTKGANCAMVWSVVPKKNTSKVSSISVQLFYARVHATVLRLLGKALNLTI